MKTLGRWSFYLSCLCFGLGGFHINPFAKYITDLQLLFVGMGLFIFMWVCAIISTNNDNNNKYLHEELDKIDKKYK